MDNIALLHDTSGSSNWGCKATVWGLKRFVSEKKPGCLIESVPMAPLPFSKLKAMRSYRENKLIDAVLAEDTDKIKSGLQSLNFDSSGNFDKYQTFILNGEGSIHKKSGHVVRLLATLYLMKKLGKKCYSINQSIDFSSKDRLGEFVRKIYSEIDFVSVREPRSKQALTELGVNSSLVPDFAFLNDENYRMLSSRDDLGEYVCVTGSSSLKKKSFAEIENLISSLRSQLGVKILFLASTKTDIALAEYASKKHPDIEIIDSTINYLEVMNIIKKSKLLAGGRFHPTVFSMVVGTPFVPFVGNTHKMQGLIEMTGASVPVCYWDNEKSISSALSDVLENSNQLNKTITKFLTSVTEIYQNVILP